jgi:hypothetical protein
MLPREWLERWLAVRRARLRAGYDLTREQVHRTRDQIKKSCDLLNEDVPKVWPAQPPKDQGPQPRTNSALCALLASPAKALPAGVGS